MTKHSKSPWQRQPDNAIGGIVDAFGNVILQAQQVKPGTDDAEREANADMACAAPELAEALAGLLTVLGSTKIPYIVMEKSISALVKAGVAKKDGSTFDANH